MKKDFTKNSDKKDKSTLKEGVYKKPNSFFVVLGIVVMIFLAAPYAVSAQNSLSGGGYVLNGGLTVVTGSGSGGGYTLNPSGDPVTGSGAGGTYSMQPTAYGSQASQPESSSPSTGGVSGGQTSGGWTTQGTTSTVAPSTTLNNQNPNIPNTGKGEGQSTVVLNPDKNPSGVEWIDGGSGVDLNFDGVPDMYQDYSIGKNTNNPVNNSYSDSGHVVKDYSSALSYGEKVYLIIFLLAVIFVPIVKRLQHYMVSRNILAVAVDDLIATHRNKKLLSVLVQNVKRNPEGERDRLYKKIRMLDRIILPIFAIVLAMHFYLEKISISIIVLICIMYRSYIRRRMESQSSL